MPIAATSDAFEDYWSLPDELSPTAPIGLAAQTPLNATTDDDNANSSHNPSIWLWAIIAAAMTASALVTSIGNLLVLNALRIEKRLHTVSNIFIGSLALADLLVGFFVMPMSAYFVLSGFRWHLGLELCQAWLTLDYVASTASILNLFALSLDRFWSITSPLRYLKKRTKKRAFLMVTLVWIVSALWCAPIVLGHIVFGGGQRYVDALSQCDTEFSNQVV